MGAIESRSGRIESRSNPDRAPSNPDRTHRSGFDGVPSNPDRIPIESSLGIPPPPSQFRLKPYIRSALRTWASAAALCLQLAPVCVISVMSDFKNVARCLNCNVSCTLGPTIEIWRASRNGWDNAFDEWCATCIMLKVTAGTVNRLATARGLGVVWDHMRRHYACEARAIAERETRRWNLTLVLMGKPYGAWTIFSGMRRRPYNEYGQFADCISEDETIVMRIVKLVVGPQAFLKAIDARVHPMASASNGFVLSNSSQYIGSVPPMASFYPKSTDM